MSETIDALAEKADVKSRVSAGVDELVDQASAKLDDVRDRAGALAAKAGEHVPEQVRPVVEAARPPVVRTADTVRENPPVALVAAVGVLVLLLVVRRRRRQRARV
jgi:MYXO-CTERM domain-containing protein